MQHTKHKRFSVPVYQAGFPGNPGDAIPSHPNPRRKRGTGQLDRQSILLLTVQGLFVVANALSGTFVNVYLWKMSRNLALIGWFALCHQAALGLTFWLAGRWVKEHNKMHSLRLGMLVSAIFYLLVLFLGPKAPHYVYGLGIVQGIAAGLFWLAYNVVYFEITEPHNRDRFNGWAGLLGAGAGMAAPWLSGYLISRMAETKGYMLIFSLSLGVFLVGVVFSLFLKKRRVDGSYEWLHGIRCLREPGSPWRRIVPALAMQGMREGVFIFVITLLVFISTGNEMKLGNYSLITSAVSLFAFYLAGRWLRPKRRIPAMLLGAILITLAITPFFWEVNYTTLLIFGIGVSLFHPLYIIPMTSTVFDFIGRDEESAAQRVEYVVLRELALNAGRMAGTILFILVISLSKDPRVLNLFLLFIGSAPIVSWFFMRAVLK
ncbi:hypothetical protein PRECH8_18710 [Insulibacter thermoxylanivorax]|uniref:Uncharacterized protein n=1 Tax=Insulibacter thermoxylanivorax TaxID=2749268 RepID=A0A916QD64_9BACL|nr:MFS transporter [Insulibacter thermoxylanivorax]GFR38575.1 hypothetical protein PRECH8_18710 [Insulibacter thermoxylanivorax]